MKLAKIAFMLLVLTSVVSAISGTFFYFKLSKDLPKMISPSDYSPPLVTRIVAKNPKHTNEGQPTVETVIGELFKNERRYLVSYDQIPKFIVQAFIAAEDDRFFEHRGVNFLSLVRAAIANFRAGHVVQGGSTITQQVTKSLLLSSERSLIRKAKEMILAYRIEKALSKEQILYLYLNQIYLGNGAYGVQAASRSYFRKELKDLTLAETTLLAGLPQAPGKYSPLLNPAKAKDRQRYVLKRMVDIGAISPKQMSEIITEPIRCYHDENINSKYSAYLVEHIRRTVIEKYGELQVYQGGLTVTLPMEPDLLQAASKSLRFGLRVVDKRTGYRGPIQKLKPDQVEKFLTEYREKLLQKSLGFIVLLPDGKTDLNEAARLAGIQSELDLLQFSWDRLHHREFLKAVVISLDDALKKTDVMIGKVRAVLPFEQMSWARPPPQEDVASIPISKPSQVLQKGDVIYIRIVENNPRGLIVALEQIPEVQGALYSVDVTNGYVIAMEGGYDFTESEFNRAIQAQRQPGSAYKPIIYSSALEKGFTPASVIVDSPIVYDSAEAGKWKPSNFEEKFYGDTTFRQALIKSRNIPTIKIVQSIHVPYLIEYSKRLGLQSLFNQDLSIALGSSALSLQDITKTYALFPRLGRQMKPTFILKIQDRNGKILEEAHPQVLPTEIKISAPTPIESKDAANQQNLIKYPEQSPALNSTLNSTLNSPLISELKPPNLPSYPLKEDSDQVLDPRIAYIMTHLMKEVVTYGTGREAARLKRPAAGKTGTTNEFIDAWFIGFSPHIVTGVWVGYDNRKPLGPGESGAKAALPIWLDFMTEAVKKYPSEDFTVPPGIVFASIDPLTGLASAPNSSRAIREAFLEGTEPVYNPQNPNPQSQPGADFFKEDIE